MRTTLASLAGMAALTLAACAQPAYLPSGYASIGYISPAAYDRNVISWEEIAVTNAASALELVQRLRPSFLNSRGAVTVPGRSSNTPTVYIDGMRYGSINTLRDIPSSQIAEIRLHRVGSASVFGPGETSGVIAIRLRYK